MEPAIKIGRVNTLATLEGPELPYTSPLSAFHKDLVVAEVPMAQASLLRRSLAGCFDPSPFSG